MSEKLDETFKPPEPRYERKCNNCMLNTKTKLAVNWAFEIKRIVFEKNV